MPALSLWQPNAATKPRLYLNGTGMDSKAKVWLEGASDDRYRVCTNVRALYGEAQRFAHAALTEIAHGAGLPVSSLRWSNLMTLAKSPATDKRGRRPTGRHTPGEAKTLDPNSMQHPLPEPTLMRVDHREPTAIREILAGVTNLKVQTAQLEMADYEVPGPDGTPVLFVERKTVNDLITSLTEDAKRLFKQTEALRLSGVPSILLIEGDLYGNDRVTLPQLAGTLSYLATIQRMAIIPTMNAEHTAYMLVKCTRHALYGLGYELGLRASGPKNPGAAAAYVLEGIPQVSAARAKRLLEEFGSLRGVALASEKDLQRVEGIGPKLAALIRETFDSENT